MEHTRNVFWQDLVSVLGWTRSSTALIGAFLLTLALIVIVWWPLAEQELALIDWERPIWGQLDWLLLGDFAAMSLLIVAGADLRTDVWIALVALFGGLAIETWGTQTGLWTYYTLEAPPLWIIPAWPIANLAVNRLARLLNLLVDHILPPHKKAHFRFLYWLIFIPFFALLIRFAWPTLTRPLTLLAIVACALTLLSINNHRQAVLVFIAAAGLGYFLELWGTTRLCWTYYTEFQPPIFAVLSHGMAAVAVWRTDQLRQALQRRWLDHRPA
ncbi:MAG: hypothetical protein JW934_05585 [Anaerolineae bacterium]|nr:hypothetical protein [Anaerolineae bacterium]